MFDHWLESTSYLFLFVNVWDLVAQCFFSNILKMSTASQEKIFSKPLWYPNKNLLRISLLSNLIHLNLTNYQYFLQTKIIN